MTPFDVKLRRQMSMNIKGYPVGTKRMDVTDEKREEVLGPKTGKRLVAARLYYPAVIKGEEKVEIPKKTVGEMYESPEIVTEKKFPLIVYNHGNGSYMESNNQLCCQLASHGYFVVSVGHLYESEKITLTDGSVVSMDKSIVKKIVHPFFRGTLASLSLVNAEGDAKEMYDRFMAYQVKYCKFLWGRLPEWAADVEAVVERLRQEYSSYIDFDRGIGLTGHSFGGNLAYYMCMNHPEKYVCGVNIDGGIFGEYEGQRMQKPFMQICNKRNIPVVSRALMDTDAPVRYEVFEDVTHMGFLDMSYYMKSKMAMGKMPYEEKSDRLVRMHLEFFGEYMGSV